MTVRPRTQPDHTRPERYPHHQHRIFGRHTCIRRVRDKFELEYPGPRDHPDRVSMYYTRRPFDYTAVINGGLNPAQFQFALLPIKAVHPLMHR